MFPNNLRNNFQNAENIHHVLYKNNTNCLEKKKKVPRKISRYIHRNYYKSLCHKINVNVNRQKFNHSKKCINEKHINANGAPPFNMY